MAETPATSAISTAPPKAKPLFFSVVMPVYNEEAVVEATLAALSAHLDACGFDYEIIVVNDGSQDRTVEILHEIEASNRRIRYIDNPGPGGYGFAIRKGLEVYKGDAVVIVTADGADFPKDVEAFFRKIEAGYDCAFGSRFMQGARVQGYPPFKLFVNRLTNRLIALLLRRGYNDFTNGFKCYRRHVVDDMQPLIAGQFNITIEMAVKAVQGGWTFAVVPNDWTQREAGASSFKLFRLIKPYGLTLLYCLSRNYLLKVRR